MSKASESTATIRVARRYDAPPERVFDAWLAPAMIGISVACAVIVIIVLMTDFDGAFIGPWG